MKKTLRFVFFMAVFALMPFMSVNAQERIVNDQDELKAAIADGTVDTIKLGGDITTTEGISVTREVIIDGDNHTITCNSTTPGEVLQYVQVDGTLKNIKLTGATGGAILADGAIITLDGAIDVSGNSLGGIRMSKSTGVTEFPDIIVDSATIVNTTESVSAPTVWIDIPIDEIGDFDDDTTDTEIDLASWPFKGAAYLIDKDQIHLFLDRANVPTGNNVIDMSDEFVNDNKADVTDKSNDVSKKEDNVAAKNPNTYDSSIFYLLFAIVSFIALGYSYTKATSR